MQSRQQLQGKSKVRKMLLNPCERLAHFLKAAQVPTGITGGVAAPGTEQVKGRWAIWARHQINMSNIQHSWFHHVPKHKMTSKLP